MTLPCGPSLFRFELPRWCRPANITQVRPHECQVLLCPCILVILEFADLDHLDILRLVDPARTWLSSAAFGLIGEAVGGRRP